MNSVEKQLGETFIVERIGYKHSLAITQKKSVYAWGNNEEGQCGVDLSEDYLDTPRKLNFPKIQKEEYIINVLTGDCHSVALTNKGTVYCWGINETGQCGVGESNEIYDRPTKVNFFDDLVDDMVIKISAGEYHTLALTTKGSVYCWGENTEGQCGVGHADGYFPTPIKIVQFNDTKIVDISSGESHNLALADTGDVFCWGWNVNGQCGLGHNSKLVDHPTPISYFKSMNDPICRIEIVDSTSCVISQKGVVYTWGSGLTIKEWRPLKSQTPFLSACLGGFYESMRFLMEQHQIKVNSQDNNTFPIIEACKSGYIEVVQYLLKHKANINLKDSQGHTAIMEACKVDEEDIVELLIVNGANLRVHSKTFETPLYNAIFYMIYLNVHLLLYHDASLVYEQYSDGQSPLHIALSSTF